MANNDAYPQEIDDMLQYIRQEDVQSAYLDVNSFVKHAGAQLAYHIMLGQYDAAAIVINTIFAMGYRVGRQGVLDKDVWAGAIDEAFQAGDK